MTVARHGNYYRATKLLLCFMRSTARRNKLLRENSRVVCRSAASTSIEIFEVVRCEVAFDLRQWLYVMLNYR